MVFDKKVQRQQ